MILDDVHRGIQKRRKRKRIGRGPGSGHGKTSGRGHKGYFSRSGASTRLGYEGGQMPLARRIAKRGFSNKRFAPKVAIINLSALQKAFQKGDIVNPETLVEKGLVTRSSQRPALYRAAIKQEKVSAGYLDFLLDNVSGGNVVPLVAHLMKERSLSANDIAELKRLIADAEQRCQNNSAEEHQS